MCARCIPAAYHVDFTIEQHTSHDALNVRHGRPGGVAVGHRIIDVNLIVTHVVPPGDHVHQAVERNRRHASARRRQMRARTPSVGFRVIDLHHVREAEEPGSARHIDVIAYSHCSGPLDRSRDRRHVSPSHTIKAFVGW